MIFSFHPDAEAEFNHAIEYYENVQAGLGYDFALEVYSTIQRAVEYPLAWMVMEGDVGVHWLAVFPMEFCILLSRNKFGLLLS